HPRPRHCGLATSRSSLRSAESSAHDARQAKRKRWPAKPHRAGAGSHYRSIAATVAMSRVMAAGDRDKQNMDVLRTSQGWVSVDGLRGCRASTRTPGALRRAGPRSGPDRAESDPRPTGRGVYPKARASPPVASSPASETASRVRPPSAASQSPHTRRPVTGHHAPHLLWRTYMGMVSLVWGILAMVWMVFALIPLVGITN